LSEIEYLHFNLSKEAEQFAEKLLENKVLPADCDNDSRHIAAAISTKCDVLLSWNLKHLANYKTNERIRLFTFGSEHQPLAILKPSVLLEGEYCYECYEKSFTPASGDQ
jgi:hypothetical protein